MLPLGIRRGQVALLGGTPIWGFLDSERSASWQRTSKKKTSTEIQGVTLLFVRGQ